MSSVPTPSPARRSAPSRRVRAVAAVLAAAVVPLAAGCGDGFTSESQTIRPNSGFGAAGGFKINNVWVVADTTTGNAEVIGALANVGTSVGTLTGVKVGKNAATLTPPVAPPLLPHPADYGRQVVLGAGQISIAPKYSVSFGQPGSPELELPGARLAPGILTTVTFSFADGASATMNVQVVPNSGLWAAYDPNAANTPTAAPRPAPSATSPATATPTPSASGGKSVGASASASVSVSASAG